MFDDNSCLKDVKSATVKLQCCQNFTSSAPSQKIKLKHFGNRAV